MKRLGQRYTHYINRSYRRSGALWEGRYRSSVVEPQEYLFACHQYIELNPVIAGYVTHPAGYSWSSYHMNAYGLNTAMLTPHQLYEQLGDTQAKRMMAYRELFLKELDIEIINKIRRATEGNYVLGTKNSSTK
jgi:putative transposase